METVATPKNRGRRIGLLALLAAVIALGVALMPMTAGAVHDINVFELDGNAADNSAAGVPDDWATLFPAPGSSTTALDETLVEDATGDADRGFGSGLTKDTQDIPNWTWTAGSVSPGKDDILHAYAATYVHDDQQLLYFGQDRQPVPNGSTAMGFWFFQNAVGLEADGSFSSTHANGDILITSDMTNGGSVSVINIFEWNDGLQLVSTLNNAECGQSLSDDIACAIANHSGPISVPWDYPEALVPANVFLEGGINLSALFQNQQVPCFSTFLAGTRTSPSETADLKDFTLGSIDTCPRLKVVKQIENGDDSTFDISVGQTKVLDDIGDGAEDVRAYDAGSYTVSETLGNGFPVGSDWTAVFSGDCNEQGQVTLAIGDGLKTCTITNTLKPKPQLRIEKSCPNGAHDNDESFQMRNNASSVGDPLQCGGSMTITLEPNTPWSITEIAGPSTSLANYIVDFSDGDCTGAGLARGASTPTCTIDNTLKAAPKLTVQKVCPDGAKSQTDTFGISNNGNATGVALSCGASAELVLGPDAAYQITETKLAGYLAEQYSSGCTDEDGLPRGGTGTCTITNRLPSTIVVTKTADPISLPEPGGPVTFTVKIENTSATDAVTISSLVDDKYGDLDGEGTCDVPQTIAAGSAYSCEFSRDVSGDAGDTHVNMVTASGTDDDADPVSDDDDATVTLTDVKPAISVEKTANPTSVAEPGRAVDFTVKVTNASEIEVLNLTSLVDDKFGNLGGKGTCEVPQTIAVGGTYTCTFTEHLSGDASNEHVNTVTATGSDDDENEVSAKDDATVAFTDVKPAISVEKTANPTSVAEPGGDVGYTVKVTNGSEVEALHLTNLTDDKFGDLDGKGTCDVPQMIAVHGSYACTFTAHVPGNAGGSHVNTVTATGSDDDENEVSANDDATVAFTNVPPTVDVTKDANVESVNEPGGDVIFTVTVWNTSHEAVTVTSLVDSVYGNLDKNDVGNHTWVSSLCDTGAKLAATDGTNGGSDTYGCTFVGAVKGEGPATHENEVTVLVTDDDESTATDKDTARVEINDVPPPPPPPPAPQIDLSVRKVDAPDPAKLNGQIGYTMLVTNAGPSTATGVTLADPLPAGTSFVSVSTTQGTCSFAGGLVQCSLGTIPAGGSVSVTLVVKATRAGVLTNEVTVVGQEPESNTANNRATAPTLVLTPLLPPKPKPVCSTLTVGPKSLRVGKRSTIAATVKNRGKAVKGAKVRVRGAGIAKSGRTNAKGKARIMVRPARPGIVIVSVPQKLVCGSKRIGVVGVFEPPVTG
jgi:uncharacterized repeat protein (TIGR01451 family)